MRSWEEYKFESIFLYPNQNQYYIIWYLKMEILNSWRCVPVLRRRKKNSNICQTFFSNAFVAQWFIFVVDKFYGLSFIAEYSFFIVVNHEKQNINLHCASSVHCGGCGGDNCAGRRQSKGAWKSSYPFKRHEHYVFLPMEQTARDPGPLRKTGGTNQRKRGKDQI